jgi:hypothetical protein
MRMTEREYQLEGPIQWRGLSEFVQQCNLALGRNAVISAGRDGLINAIDLSDSDLVTLGLVNKRLNVLDSWESSKLRNLTIQDINNRIATVQTQIDAVTNVATAKTALNSMYADMQKMARVIIWLLKREMNGL